MARRRERRRSPRLKVEGLTASYWTGAVPCPQPVLEIGMAGAVIETGDAYYPGTLMQLALARLAGADAGGLPVSFSVWARAVRQVPKGICMEFVFQDEREIEGFRRFLADIHSEPPVERRAARTVGGFRRFLADIQRRKTWTKSPP